MKKTFLFLPLVVIMSHIGYAMEPESTNYEAHFFYGSKGLFDNTTDYFVGSGFGQNIIDNATDTLYEQDIGVYYIGVVPVTTTSSTTTTTQQPDTGAGGGGGADI
jgi:hypothetical protein